MKDHKLRGTQTTLQNAILQGIQECKDPNMEVLLASVYSTTSKCIDAMIDKHIRKWRDPDLSVSLRELQEELETMHGLWSKNKEFE